MEEEGTVVYYEDSPSGLLLQGCDKDDLLIQQGAESQQGAGPSWAESWYKWVWQCIPVIKLYNESNYLMKLSSEILESSLLTDEDLHLLNSAQVNHTHQDIPPSPAPIGFKGYQKWLFLFCPLLALIWMPHPFIVVMGVVILTLPWLVSWWVETVFSRALKSRSEYYTSFEKLLTQLTTTIRWIQEVEVVSRGMTRPLSSARLDRCHTHSLLRRHTLRACADLIGPLRVATRDLCHTHSIQLAPELEARASYLAFRPISELHPFMREEEGEVKGKICLEEGDEFVGSESMGSEFMDSESGSLESLKDACSLVAVQNSELLRRLCLLATAGAHNRGLATPTQFIPHLLTLQNSLLSVRLSAVVEGLVPLIRACSQELTWRLSFHSNMLFGAPPTRPVVSPPNDTRPAIPPLLSADVHYLDLKAQCLLQRVRDFGVLLKSCDSLPTQQLLESHMSTIQSDLRGVADAVESVASLVWTREEDTEMRRERESTPPPDVCDGGGEGDGVDEEIASQGKDSDEEEIFEGYVSESDVQSGRGEGVWVTEEVGGACEVPGHVIRELKDVLIVRNHIREKRKEMKRRRGHGTTSITRGHVMREGDHVTKGSHMDEEGSKRYMGEEDHMSKAGRNTPGSQPSEVVSSTSTDHTPPATPINSTHPLSIQLAAAIKGRKPFQEHIYS